MFCSVSPEIKLPKTFSALYLWKSNLYEITGDHANENYEVNTVEYIQNLHTKNSALFKGTTNIRKLIV